MTPKEKAKELYNKFYNTSSHPHHVESRKNNAIKCALIAVDEIIASNPIAFDEDDNCIEKQWWQEVKQQIELL
jgi:hypothetical protein